eukprot:382390-Prorocentrum_minimum.AAC.1
MNARTEAKDPWCFLDVAQPRSNARPDFRSVRAKRGGEGDRLLGGDRPAGGPGKEAAQRQGKQFRAIFIFDFDFVILIFDNGSFKLLKPYERNSEVTNRLGKH